MAQATQATVRGTTVPVGANNTVDLNAFVGGLSDRIPGNYYDTLQLDPATTFQSSYNFFINPLNAPDPYPLASITGAAPVRTKVETNMPASAQQGFPAPWDIIVDSLGWFVQQDTIKADMDLLTQYSYFEFAILGKVQWDGKIDVYPAGVGLSGYSTQSNESGWQLGLPDPNARKRFGHYGKYLAPLMNWSMTPFFPPQSGPVTAPATVRGAATLTAANATPTPGAGLVLRSYLFGLVDRPVS